MILDHPKDVPHKPHGVVTALGKVPDLSVGVSGAIEGGADMAVHHSEKMIQGNGIDICTDAFGDINAPVILLIMGAGCSMLHWDEIWCHRIAGAGRFVIRYDNRDTGRTTSLPPGECNYSFADMAADAVAVLDHYGVESAHIIGQSMGRIIAQLVALNYPERVLTLTPIMTTANPPGLLAAVEATQEADDRAQTQQASQPAAPDLETVLASVPAMLESAVGSAHPPEIDRMRDVISRDFDRSISYSSSANHGLVFAQSQSLLQRLGSITVPTLVIHGTEDPIVPYAHGEEIAAKISGAQLLTMNGVGHWLPRPEYDRLDAAILEHTSRQL